MTDTDTTCYVYCLSKGNYVSTESTPFVWTDIIRATMASHIQGQTVIADPEFSYGCIPASCVKTGRVNEQDVDPRPVTPLVIGDVDSSNR